jgi:hypothetical protein
LRNKFEKRIAQQLSKAKVRFRYEPYKIPYVLACHYVTDFEIEVPTGSFIVETKGYLRPEDRRKLVAVKRQHPEKDIRICFFRANKRDIKWADRNGFRYCIGKIPKEWLEGL